MATAIVKLPDGRRAKIRIPDGMGMEEATSQLQTMYDTTPEAFQSAAPAPEAAQPAATPNVAQQAAPMAAPAQQQAPQEPGMLGKMDQFAAKYIPPYGMATGVARGSMGEAPRSEFEAYGGGVARALRDMGMGTRQAFNKLTGDDEELARLGEQEATSRDQFRERTAEYPLSSIAGKVAGSVGAPVAAAAMLPGVAATGGVGLGLKALLGAGAGGAAGYSQPLTGEEEGKGKRETGALVGSLVGGAAPLAGAGISKFLRSIKKVGADDALEHFAGKQLSATHERGASGAYGRVTGAIDDQYQHLKQQFGKLYDDVENAIPRPVKLKISSKLGKEALSLPEEVSNGLSPTARRVADSMEKGATNTSPIVNTAGKPIQQARDVSFKDVRDTIRELRGAKRALPYTDAGIQQSKRLDNIIASLDDDLQAWGDASEDAGKALKAARELDMDYSKQVAPFVNKESPIGAFRRGMGDEAAFDKAFLKGDKGQAMGDLLRRVPEAKAPARELYGQKLLTPAGPTPKRKALESGTLGEALLDTQERAFLKEVSTALGDQASSGPIRTALSGMIKDVGMNKVNTMLRGVEKFGTKPKRASVLADMLRAYSAGQLATED